MINTLFFFGAIWIIIGFLLTAFLLSVIGTAVGMDNAEFHNCLIAVIIYRILNVIVYWILPFTTILSFSFFLGAAIVLAINTWVIAGVLSTTYGKAFFTALLIFIISMLFPLVF